MITLGIGSARCRRCPTACSALQTIQRSETCTGKPKGSVLDPHEAFMLGRVREKPDTSLEEIVERLAAERGVRVVWTAVWKFLDRRNQTHKRTAHVSEQERPDVKAACQRWSDSQPGLAPRELDLHRRKRALDQDGPPAWVGAEGATLPCRDPAWSFEDRHLRRRPDAGRLHRPMPLDGSMDARSSGHGAGGGRGGCVTTSGPDRQCGGGHGHDVRSRADHRTRDDGGIDSKSRHAARP
ncbi:hypothetical protein SAMN02745126_05773 [Enhydrobacter aerosaccus]|uniref:Transposase n=1 Tax=Enhydrobacter aerosaccus TaxID=225324 RepID=A0A1T4T6N0_9HYPH|nr:hypothetical protein SAMN02745126_05773 [Enhydrobacter aerosaccus]